MSSHDIKQAFLVIQEENLYRVWKEVDVDRLLGRLILRVNLLEPFTHFPHSCHALLTVW